MDDYNEASQPDQSVRSKLNKMFSRYDYVAVFNPLKVDFEWSVALEQNEIVNMGQGEMNEERMAQSVAGQFMPNDGVTRAQTKVVKVSIKAGQKRMLPGEAAYVVVPRIFDAYVHEKFGFDKVGFARLRNPATQTELLKEIVVGPIVNNVAAAMETYVNEKMGNIQEGFSDVQVEPTTVSKGFSDPAVLAKAQATRAANQAAKAQSA